MSSGQLPWGQAEMSTPCLLTRLSVMRKTFMPALVAARSSVASLPTIRHSSGPSPMRAATSAKYAGLGLHSEEFS